MSQLGKILNRRTALQAIVGTWLLILPATALATPITYRFGMPAFLLAGELGGRTSILDVTVDNGGASIFNQTYLNTEITGLAVSVNDTSLSLSLNAVDHTTFFQGSIPYITTDNAGAALLDLSTDQDTLALFRIGVQNTIQLGTRDGNGPTEYAVRIENQFGFNSAITTVAGSALQVVPEPATVLLLGAGLVGLFTNARRRFR